MTHKPGRGHRRKSDPQTKKRFRRKATRKKVAAQQQFEKRHEKCGQNLIQRTSSRDGGDRNMPARPTSATTRRKFRTKWGELEHLCAVIHRLWYTQGKKAKAKEYVPRLDKLLAELPPNDVAILREDGFALLCEITGRIGEAIKHRKREIRLMEKLHQDVESKDYTEEMKSSILVNRDSAVMQDRRAILQALEDEITANGAASKPSRRKQARHVT
jgi:hypothetical protein